MQNNDQPPSASGERDWSDDATHENGQYQCLCSKCGSVFVGHKRRITCKLCAELAPSPGIDAAEQKPIPLHVIRQWPEGMQARVEHVWNDLRGFTVSYKLHDLCSVLAEFGFTMTVTEAAPPAAQPLHDCCANCMRPQAEHDGVQCPKPFTTVWHAWDYDFAPGAEYVAAQPSAAWVAEAERLADLYASACAYAEVPEATGYRLPIQTTRAAMLDHLRTKP